MVVEELLSCGTIVVWRNIGGVVALVNFLRLCLCSWSLMAVFVLGVGQVSRVEQQQAVDSCCSSPRVLAVRKL
jgi:hypothetical protein